MGRNTSVSISMTSIFTINTAIGMSIKICVRVSVRVGVRFGVGISIRIKTFAIMNVNRRGEQLPGEAGVPGEWFAGRWPRGGHA